jgi:transposase
LVRSLRRGDVVVLDNLGAHKASWLEQVAEERGAQVLWLPPYSPDYSPIENCWSKIKTHGVLRKPGRAMNWKRHW